MKLARQVAGWSGFTQGWEGEEGLHTHGLGGHQAHGGGVPGPQDVGLVLHPLARAAVHPLLQLVEAAAHVGGVAVQHGGVARLHLSGVVQDDHLGTGAT